MKAPRGRGSNSLSDADLAEDVDQALGEAGGHRRPPFRVHDDPLQAVAGRAEETVVLVLTGNSLKDPDFTMGFHRGDLFKGSVDESASGALDSLRRPPIVLDATLEAVIRTLEQAEK